LPLASGVAIVTGLDSVTSSSLLAFAITWRRREAVKDWARFSSNEYMNELEELMKKLTFALLICFALSGLAAAAVNINTATKEELMTLKGVGDKRAQEIIDYRKKNGNFKSIDDLEKVPGIGPGLMKQIRSEVTVTGKTSADKTATKSKAPESEKSKGGAAKTAEAPKGDAMKAEKANEKVAEKSKADEKKTDKK
jgi:competence protein ComEA